VLTVTRAPAYAQANPAMPKSAVSLLPFLLVVALLAAAGAASGETPPLSFRVAAVQLSMDASLLASAASFSDRIEGLVAQALEFRPDLIVFPEYTSVFLALLPYYEDIRASSGALEGLKRISRREPLVKSFRDLFLLNSGLARRAMDEIFGALARSHGVPILAGSYFAWDRREGEVRLVNRAVLFGSDGRVAYSQDKVFLTPFEGEVLGLSAGSLEDAAPFRLNGQPVGVTICRDAFFGQWQERLRGSLLWIDIKANGERFTEQEQARFLRALPARIGEGTVPYGLTVCLTGSFLDLYWEGESSLVRKDGHGGTEVLARAANPAAEQVLLLEIPLPVDSASGP
jgi:predicted amidohydrolase